MKSDNAIRNGTSIFVGIIVAIAAFVRGALLLPLLLVACSVWGLYCFLAERLGRVRCIRFKGDIARENHYETK
ncbi:hypothetical protein [Gemmiger sp.]